MRLTPVIYIIHSVVRHCAKYSDKLNQLACKSALRIATTPTYKRIIECRSKKRTRIKTNLEVLLNTIQKQTGLKPEETETSTPFLTPPWWAPPPITIAPSKNLAIDQHNTTVQNSVSQGLLPIYTDGSGINGKIGASAVTSSISDQAYLGPDTQYTVFTGELYGIHLALHIAYFIIQIQKKRKRPPRHNFHGQPSCLEENIYS